MTQTLWLKNTQKGMSTTVTLFYEYSNSYRFDLIYLGWG